MPFSPRRVVRGSGYGRAVSAPSECRGRYRRCPTADPVDGPAPQPLAPGGAVRASSAAPPGRRSRARRPGHPRAGHAPGLAGMGNAMLARWVDGDPADDKLADDLKDLGNLDDAGRIERIQKEVGGGDARLIEILWGGFSDPEKAAKANPDLFAKLGRARARAREPRRRSRRLQEKFKSDVEAVALGHLSANRNYVTAEMEKLGVSGKDEPPNAEQQHALREVQKAARADRQVRRGDRALQEHPGRLRLGGRRRARAVVEVRRSTTTTVLARSASRCARPARTTPASRAGKRSTRSTCRSRR